MNFKVGNLVFAGWKNDPDETIERIGIITQIEEMPASGYRAEDQYIYIFWIYTKRDGLANEGSYRASNLKNFSKENIKNDSVEYIEVIDAD